MGYTVSAKEVSLRSTIDDGSLVEEYEVGGQPLVERFPWTRYHLG